jgi:hypothetical protein
MMPTTITNEKSRKAGPPKAKRNAQTIQVKSDVRIVRERV